MKKNLYLTFLIIIAFSSDAYPQVHLNYFAGRITGEQFPEESNITFLVYGMNQLNRRTLPDTAYAVSIDSEGRFEFKFKPPSKFFYMAMKIYSGENELNTTSEFLHDPYLCERGDSISATFRLFKKEDSHPLNIIRSANRFSGRGAEKLNCQYLLKRIDPPVELRGPLFFNNARNKRNPKQTEADARVFEAQLILRKSVIEQYKNIVADNILNMIKADTEASVRYRFAYTNILRYYWNITADESESISSFLKESTVIASLLSDNNSLIHALSYPDFVLARDEAIYRITYPIDSISEKNLNRGHLFDWMFNNIKTKYFGVLRDRLLITWFAEPHYKSSEGEIYANELSALKESISFVGNKSDREYLENLLDARSGSNKAFPFRFIDEQNQIHNLEDYSDKVLVLDFWFTGCLACTKIPLALRPVMEKFEGRKDVVFLSINVDNSIEIWQRGLMSGLYTLSKQVHLKTTKSGTTDTFVTHYKFEGFPRVMVIGKNGIMLSVSEDPRPDNGKSMIRLIERNL